MDGRKERMYPWVASALMFLVSGIAWVASIPLLMFSLGGSIQPHVGWLWGVAIAVLMFSILVQVDQRIAAGTVLVVSFSSAWVAQNMWTTALAVMATGLTMLNGIQRVCGPLPNFVDLQCQLYAGYHQVSELDGAFESVQPGRSFFACHPHGILSIGWISNVVWNRKFHHTAGRCFYLLDKTLRNKGLLARPLCDAFEGSHGGLRDNTRETMLKLMAKGESLCMTPGAFQEATSYVFKRHRVYLKQRKGFVKYCLRYGYRLHPVYTFGETETYYTLGGFESFRFWLNGYGIPTVAFVGLWFCPMLPRRGLELRTYIGEPVELPKIESPTDAEVDLWHDKYVEALCAVFDKNKAKAGKPNAVLQVL